MGVGLDSFLVGIVGGLRLFGGGLVLVYGELLLGRVEWVVARCKSLEVFYRVDGWNASFLFVLFSGLPFEKYSTDYEWWLPFTHLPVDS